MLYGSVVLKSILTLAALPQVIGIEREDFGNLSVTFFPSHPDEEIGCPYYSDAALIFRTVHSYPQDYTCFNFRDLFRGNRTTGTTSGVSWVIEHAKAFDIHANYSHVRYTQFHVNRTEHIRTPLIFTVFGEEDCLQSNASGYSWHKWSCTSNEEDACRDHPYSVASFSLQAGKYYDNQDECVEHAKEGAGVSSLGNVKMAAVGAFVSTVVASILVA